jgi:hypothetical protein
MRANEFLIESRGVTARTPGETYVSVSNPSDVLTFQEVIVIPDNAPAFETADDLLDAIDQVIPAGERRIEDNNSNQGTKAAVIARVTDIEGNDQYWIRYLKSIPAKGVHGTWATLNGYKYGKAAKQESIPIKPTDIIKDDGFRSADTLAQEVKTNVAGMVQGTAHEPLASMINQAVDLAARGQVAPIPGAAEYAAVIGKYAGEYLGPIAVIKGNVRKGDIDKMLKVYNLKSLAGSTVSFPQDAANALVDSLIKTPTGIELGISTKLKKGGGAASSLKGIVNLVTPQIREKYPKGTQIIEILGTKSAHDGPLEVSKMYGIITDGDITAINRLDKSSQNINDLMSPKLQAMARAQGIAKDTMASGDYRVYFHAMTALVNAMVSRVNQDPEFYEAMKLALNNNNFLQLLTDARVKGKDLTLDYMGKYPAVFEGKPQLWNKTYFATGNKGRIGFKLV